MADQLGAPTLLDQVLEAEASDRELLSSPASADLIAQVQRLARRLGLRAVHPASRAGDRVAGAVLFAAGGSLRLWDGCTREGVLVVDGAVASTVGVSQVVARLQALGLTNVHGVAVAGRSATVAQAPPQASVTVLRLGSRRRSAA